MLQTCYKRFSKKKKKKRERGNYWILFDMKDTDMFPVRNFQFTKAMLILRSHKNKMTF